MRRLLATLAATFALLGAGNVATADAHLGDWWTQYVRTYDHCAGSFGGCAYWTSGPYSEHSRVFYYYNDSLYIWYYIGHNYHIWGIEFWGR